MSCTGPPPDDNAGVIEMPFSMNLYKIQLYMISSKAFCLSFSLTSAILLWFQLVYHQLVHIDESMTMYFT
jgi:hypothetical protein